jgi:hypothetical protein
LHAFWAHPERLKSMLANYETKLRRLCETALRIDPGASIALFSDHGMAPVTHRYDLMKNIDALNLKMPEDYLVVYDSTMARFWFFNEQARTRVEACLRGQTCGQMLDEAEQQRLGVYFPDHRFGETIFLLNSGCMFYRSDFHSGNWLPTGMHGYHPSDPYSDAVLLTNRPAASQMSTICDIYGYMERAAGLRSAQLVA